MPGDTLETLRHDGRETAYRVVEDGGDGPTTLYVHGSGGNHGVWVEQYAPTGPAHPAVALDLSGHGASDDVATDPGPETLAAYVEDVRAVARATDAGVLVGNSLGGAVVLRGVLDDRLDPSAIVLAGTGAKLAVHGSLRTALAENFERAVEMLHDDDRLFRDAPPDVVERSKDAMYETGRAVTERDFLSCHTFDVRNDLDGIGCPALALVGEYDELTPVAYHEYLADHIPNGELAVVEDAAHLAMLERPAAFTDALERFLAARQF